MRIAIVGGGATGALAAIHLARRHSGGPVDIVLIEPSAALGKGLAYSTRDPRHLLNVRVGNMAAFADEPDHLHQWLKARGELDDGRCPSPFCFISRATYGDYIGELVDDLIVAGKARHVRDSCVDLVEDSDGVTLKLASGRSIAADRVLLATGHDARPTLYGVHAEQPWTEGSLEGLPPHVPVLIIGSGLTMVDMALSLDRRGHKGPIMAVSRRGLFPQAHRPVTVRQIGNVPVGAELSQWLAWLRGLAARIAAEGGDWRSAVDALRPHTQRLWRAMTLTQRRRFLRHARAYWDVHRHRMAPEVERRIAAMRQAGRLKVVAGRVLWADQRGDWVDARILPRNGTVAQEHRFGRVIDCAGLADDPRRSANPLIGALLARGATRVDLLGIGLDVAPDGALIDAAGKPSHRVQAIGPLARASLWECIAIPDIRLQCQDVAEQILPEPAESGPGEPHSARRFA